MHAPPPESPAEAPAEADLPPVDKLTEDSDLSAFFSPRVSEELRTLALRRLFGMPKFNLRDGLDDYDGDYRNFAPLGEVMTADLRHRLEVEAARVQAALAAEPARNGSQAEDSPPMERAAGEADVAGVPGADTPGVDTEEPS